MGSSHSLSRMSKAGTRYGGEAAPETRTPLRALMAVLAYASSAITWLGAPPGEGRWPAATESSPGRPAQRIIAPRPAPKARTEGGAYLSRGSFVDRKAGW